MQILKNRQLAKLTHAKFCYYEDQEDSVTYTETEQDNSDNQLLQKLEAEYQAGTIDAVRAILESMTPAEAIESGLYQQNKKVIEALNKIK